MANSPVRHLFTAVVHEQDADVAIHALHKMEIPVIHLASSGGFLGQRNSTLLIGLPDGMEENILVTLKDSCRQRVEYVAIPLEGSPLPLPSPVPVTVGGATIFVLPVERFEEF
jgi:uncharacterized protein YaaQ